MDTQMIFDMIGYAASLITLISMLMANVVKLRVINCVGCVVFIIYAYFIGSYPIALFNAAIIIINIVHIIRFQKQNKNATN